MFDDGRDDEVETIWSELLSRHDLAGQSPDFVRDEWEQVVRARGIADQAVYFKTPRTGGGTPLDRKALKALWTIFEAFRAKMLDEKIIEPEDAYREAHALLLRDGPVLPYMSVIADWRRTWASRRFA